TAERAVQDFGGVVTRELALVNGFAATVPGGSAGLEKSQGILAVTPDLPLRVQGSTYTPTTDAGAPAAIQLATGATTFWKNGFYGQGVGIAVIDSGVVPQDGLRRVYYGPDFSPEVANTSLKFLDTYGHGTFMASLIAGKADGASRPYTNNASYVGIAPEATIVSVKVADALGNTTESAVVAGVEWVVQHMYDKSIGVNNIRVINLSVGVPDSGYANDPLAAAIEKAWSYCITVVSSAGNDGAVGLTLPAADPYAIAVGAVDNRGTVATADDTVAAFSNTGNGKRNPDLVAPGTHVVGLRNSGGYIDLTYGATGAVGTNLFRGSGTSESSAIVAGAAALLISQRPDLNPDVVKAILMDSAKPLPGVAATSQGAGQLNLNAAYSQASRNVYANFPHAANWDLFTSQQSGGTWSNYVWQSPTYSPTAGGQGGTLSNAAWTGQRWTGQRWTGQRWTGATWASTAWASKAWG
ncbi:MAG: peptidase and in, kexin, sedolisin, partial [Frankiales bacterium]|nr:peptidase and in, kexin, sedolisin [Frankiales bacterium]